MIRLGLNVWMVRSGPECAEGRRDLTRCVLWRAGGLRRRGGLDHGGSGCSQGWSQIEAQGYTQPSDKGCPSMRMGDKLLERAVQPEKDGCSAAS